MKEKIIGFVLAIALVACRPQNTAVTGTQATLSYHATPIPTVIPTPIASKCTVVGKIESASGQSVAGLVLYFGTILSLTPGPDHLINVDPANSPKATIGTDGRFIAVNITPGEYVLILWTPHESRFIPDSKNSEKEFIVRAESGQIVDIGTLQAPSLP